MAKKIHFAERGDEATACERVMDRFIRNLPKGEGRTEWQNGDHVIMVSPSLHEITCRKCRDVVD